MNFGLGRRWAAALLTSVFVISSVAAPTRVHAASLLSAATVEKAVRDLYAWNPVSGAEEFGSEERAEAVRAVAELVAMLPPPQYNSVLSALLADYRKQPAVRETLDLLFVDIRATLSSEFEQQRLAQPLVQILDDVFAVWIGAYAVGFGKGLLKSRGVVEGLEGLPCFQAVVKTVVAQLPRERKVAPGITSAGTAVGVAHVLLERVQVRRLDPDPLVERIRLESFREIQAEINELKERLRTGREPALQTWEAKLAGRLTELEYFYRVLPERRGEMAPLADDCREILALAKQWRLREEAKFLDALE